MVTDVSEFIVLSSSGFKQSSLSLEADDSTNFGNVGTSHPTTQCYTPENIESSYCVASLSSCDVQSGTPESCYKYFPESCASVADLAYTNGG
jgi:hypothetical protein